MDHLLSHRLRTLSIGKLARFALSLAARAMFVALFPLAYVGVLAYGKISGKRYRFGTISLSSIGGSARLDAFLRRTRSQSQTIKYVFVPRYEPVINPYFYELMKRHVTVIEAPFLKLFLTSLVRVPNRLRFIAEVDYMHYDEAGRYPPIDWFSEQDKARGKKLLQNLGITGEDAWYVCFFARDNAYNETYNSGDERRNNVTYHSLRNSDIDTYTSAMQFVLDQGGYVIRMGMVVSKPVSLEHPRLIDYPFSEFRSDFADIYLICHGKFVIGSGSGITCLSSLVDMPFGCVNSVPLSYGYGRKNLILIPKMIRSSRNNRYLSACEYQDLLEKWGPDNNIIVIVGVMRENNLVYVDNSPADILMVAKVMYRDFVETRVGYEEPPWKDGQIWPEFLERYPAWLSN